jgi:glycosyltransferase involved in cell wall biosynthesis
MTVRQRILIVTADVVNERRAGPAIRAVALARELARSHDVTLVSTSENTLPVEGVRSVQARGSALRPYVADSAVIILQGFVSYHAPWLLRTDKIIVIDLYDPMHLEQLEHVDTRPPVEHAYSLDLTAQVLNEQLARGDFFLCANDRQRHLWLGQLAAVGRINPANYARDVTLDALIAICPFGIEDADPRRAHPAIRGVVDGISAGDKVAIWAGGIYNWFDPVTLVHAIDKVHRAHDDVRLFFLGTRHPNPEVPEMRVAWATRQLADELGLTDRHVFFNDGWVPYDERADYLLEADAGVSTHLHQVETTFAFRTRMLDYLWAALPIVATGGDGFGDLVAERGLGRRVEPQDVDGLAAALTAVLYDPEVSSAARRAVSEVREEYRWSRVLAPLVAFCAEPRRAADATQDQTRLLRHAAPPRSFLMKRVAWEKARLRDGGPAAFGASAISRLARRVRSR